MAPNTEEYNSDELEAPTWLDAECIATILRNCEKNSSDLEVASYKISPGTAKGDHYASIMFRVNVEYRVAGVDKEKSMIVKTMPEVEGHKKELLGESYIFETEIGMYTEVLPRFEQILRAAGDDTVLMAPCLYYALSPRKLIVFEDIVPKGYKVLRDRSPAGEELRAAYMKLAKWHAISYKINKEEPKYFEKYRHSIFSNPSVIKDPAMTGGVAAFIAAYKSEPRLEKYIKYFEELESNLVEKCVECAIEFNANPQPDACYVLCHGDFHLRNMMLKHNETTGKFEDVMLLDFQFCYMGPSVLDLIYSFHMLLEGDLRLDASAYFQYYLTHFNETLRKIGFDGPLLKISQLNEQIKRHKYFHFFIAVTFMPVMTAVKEGTAEITDFMAPLDYRVKFYRNENIIKEFERLLSKYEYEGYFEDL